MDGSQKQEAAGSQRIGVQECLCYRQIYVYVCMILSFLETNKAGSNCLTLKLSKGMGAIYL